MKRENKFRFIYNCCNKIDCLSKPIALLVVFGSSAFEKLEKRNSKQNRDQQIKLLGSSLGRFFVWVFFRRKQTHKTKKLWSHPKTHDTSICFFKNFVLTRQWFIGQYPLKVSGSKNKQTFLLVLFFVCWPHHDYFVCWYVNCARSAL